MRGRLRAQDGANEPDVASVAALVAEPARARMLMALMGGLALTATELALEAGVSPSTASGHLAMLSGAAAVTVVKQGRHRYYRLVDPRLAAVLEQMMGISAGGTKRRPGPVDPALRYARVCFDHLAGRVATELLELCHRQELLVGPEPWSISPKGEQVFRHFGLPLDDLARGRRALVRGCLDWSERRPHLAGALGAAILDRLFALGWASRQPTGRAVTFTPAGERSLRQLF